MLRARRLRSLLPLLEQGQDFTPRILDDAVHLNVVLVIAKGVFELLADAIDAVQRERYDGDDGDTPPYVVVDNGKGKHTSEESEDLLLVDATEGYASARKGANKKSQEDSQMRDAALAMGMDIRWRRNTIDTSRAK